MSALKEFIKRQKEAPSKYRGADNPKANKNESTERRMVLSDDTRERGGKKSKRKVAKVWVEA